MPTVEGNVVLETDGVRVRLEGNGSSLVARVEGVGALGLLRAMQRVPTLARAVVPLLLRAGFTVDVFAGAARVARAGTGVEANRLARMLDLPNVRIGR